jgi:hypothetical protein
VGAAFLWETIGGLLSAPGRALDLSPFHHVGLVPAEAFETTGAVVMVAVGALAASAAAWAFNRRDVIGTCAGECLAAQRVAPENMEHQFTIPARVVEVTDEAPQEAEPDTDEILPPAPAATDDGTPVSKATKPPKQRSR